MPPGVELEGEMLMSGSAVAPGVRVTESVMEEVNGRFRLRLTVPAKLLRL